MAQVLKNAVFMAVIVGMILIMAVYCTADIIVGDVSKLKPLTAEQTKALEVNNTTLQQVVDIAMDKQMRLAKWKLAEELTRRVTIERLNEIITNEPNSI